MLQLRRTTMRALPTTASSGSPSRIVPRGTASLSPLSTLSPRLATPTQYVEHLRRFALNIHLETLRRRHPALAPCIEPIQQAFTLMRDSLQRNGTLFLAGNGGS